MELQVYYPRQQHQNDGSFWRDESLTLELRSRRVGRQSLGTRRIRRHLSWRCAMETCHSQFDCRWRPDDGGSNRGPWAQVTPDCCRLVSLADRYQNLRQPLRTHLLRTSGWPFTDQFVRSAIVLSPDFILQYVFLFDYKRSSKILRNQIKTLIKNEMFV